MNGSWLQPGCHALLPSAGGGRPKHAEGQLTFACFAGQRPVKAWHPAHRGPSAPATHGTPSLLQQARRWFAPQVSAGWLLSLLRARPQEIREAALQSGYVACIGLPVPHRDVCFPPTAGALPQAPTLATGHAVGLAAPASRAMRQRRGGRGEDHVDGRFCVIRPGHRRTLLSGLRSLVPLAPGQAPAGGSPTAAAMPDPFWGHLTRGLPPAGSRQPFVCLFALIVIGQLGPARLGIFGISMGVVGQEGPEAAAVPVGARQAAPLDVFQPGPSRA
jgi:hypothetical protein